MPQHDEVSEREPIPEREEHEPPPEQAEPKNVEGEGFLEPSEAEDVLREAIEVALDDPGIPYEQEVLEAAASLREQDRPEFERLKAEISEFVDMRKWPSLVDDACSDLQVRESRSRSDRPTIFRSDDLHEAEQQCCEALRDYNGIYERSGELVELYDAGDGPEVGAIDDKDRLASILSEAARFEAFTKDGTKTIHPPRRVVGAVASRHTWGVNRLRGIVDGAAFLNDGTILTTEGYHPDAELYLRHGADVSGLRSPTQADAREAYEILTDLLVDFEFVDERRAAHEAVWVALILTMLARPAIGRKESTPMFLFDANRPGVGKTRLVNLACEIARGILPSPRPAPTGQNSNDQMRKAITSAARSGDPVIFFDNVKGTFGGGSLELALTGKKWSSRILHKSKDWSGHLMVTWVATANNITLTTDMERRTLLCQIETNSEDPSEREDFKYPHIEKHVRQHRQTYLEAGLTLLRAWHVEGEPTFDLTPWGSFEEWSRVVRNAIRFAGGADPYQTRKDLEAADRETMLLRAVLNCWPEGERFTATQLARGMKDNELPVGGGIAQTGADVLGPLQELLGTKSPSHVSRKLGWYENRVEGGKKLETSHDDDGRTLWGAVDVPDGKK